MRRVPEALVLSRSYDPLDASTPNRNPRRGAAATKVMHHMSAATFPETVVQTCVVHVIRNAMRFISYEGYSRGCVEV